MIIEFAKADYGLEEIDAVNRVLKSEWLASGHENELFEKEFAEYVGSKHAVCCNSGSSANLLALSSLGLPAGSKVLTSACGFPATLSPILHLGLCPILVDYDSHTFNINIEHIKEKKCDAIILAHTLGNPVDIEQLKDLGVPIIEDCCEAVGSKIKGKSVGITGKLGTFSFYPAHQMTACGGGGMVVTDDFELYKRMKSMRDWGKMYDWDSDKGGNQTDYCSPIGYHRGYTYDTIGWNFKLPEANAAFGRVQLKKLEDFRKIRMRNWLYLRSKLTDCEEVFRSPATIAPMGDDASPFGFCMTHPNRNKFGEYLESKGIKHRPFFAGNILRQPAFKDSMADNFPVADKLMKTAMFIGCHTKLKSAHLDYMVGVICDYCRNS